jgi:hypothetical protein
MPGLGWRGVHPLHHRKTEELKQITASGNTFKAIASDWIETNRKRWTPYFLRQFEGSMASAVFPQIGALPIKQVTAAQRAEDNEEARGSWCGNRCHPDLSMVLGSVPVCSGKSSS